MEPKIIEVPGIPGKLQEMTLDQYVSTLSADHLARKQLDEIRAQALRAVEISNQLVKANERIMELQQRLILVTVPAPLPSPFIPPTTGNPIPPETYTTSFNPSTELAPPPAPDKRSGPFPKVPCPICGKPTSTSPGAWASHQRNNHPDNPVPRPNV